ncbi:MAG: type II toxin-antitoxin system RelB/DinJ family antitoxin [Clostridiales Family XIII bacterium]|jgi:DNA-damage-inducible protein J|nr:type II toxin-antitoxin system RelB/DinJ family antitoxin [Clostridiales Family XIII bacterium]
MSSVPLNIKVDGDLKRQADAIFADIGLTTSAGINVYLKKVVASRGIPFELKADADDEADAMRLTRKLSRGGLNHAW